VSTGCKGPICFHSSHADKTAETDHCNTVRPQVLNGKPRGKQARKNEIHRSQTRNLSVLEICNAGQTFLMKN